MIARIDAKGRHADAGNDQGGPGLMKGPKENYIIFSKKNNSGRQGLSPVGDSHKDTKAPLGFMILHRHHHPWPQFH